MREFGADIDLERGEGTIRSLLASFADAVTNGMEARFHIAARRDRKARFLVWNEVERLHLQDRVSYHPYVDTCRRFPVRKSDSTRWFDNDTPLDLARAAPFTRSSAQGSPRTVLFVTYMHPWKHEGNSKLMRDWLNDFRAAGYRIHLLYYAGDGVGVVTPEMEAAAEAFCDLVERVEICSPLVGSNSNGLNVHVDDWCGPELLDAVTSLAGRYSYDMAFVNYAFLSAVFDRVHAYTRRFLLTHDRLEDRNRRMLAQGFAESGWLSLTRAGEALACDRADTVLAIQPEEAAYFRSLVSDPGKVAIASPVLEPMAVMPPRPGIDQRLRIGYFGSHNWVNELNFKEFLKTWLTRPALRGGSTFVLAGGICDHLADFVDADTLATAAPLMMGRVDDLAEFFAVCDVVINPERGGTGLKIKSLETMAHGVPLLCTAAGAVGFGSESRFHSAPDISALTDLVAEVVADRGLVAQAREETSAVYARYLDRNRDAVASLIGPPLPKIAPISARGIWPPAPDLERAVRFPGGMDFVTSLPPAACARDFTARVNPAGRRVLVLNGGGDWQAERVFLENGATEILSVPAAAVETRAPPPDCVLVLPCLEAGRSNGTLAADLICRLPAKADTPETVAFEARSLVSFLPKCEAACLYVVGEAGGAIPDSLRGLEIPLLAIRAAVQASERMPVAGVQAEPISGLWMQYRQTIAEDATTTPSVSVIVPFYNVQDYIDACLISLREQDYPLLEIILVDDASPDGSRAIAERHAAEDGRISIETHAKNSGLGPSRNTGMARASGTYLFFVDSDDVMAGPDVLRHLVDAARVTGSQVTAGRAERLLADGTREPFDAEHERRAGASAGETYAGREAYLATFGLPGLGYLPMRAWGYLIDADFYRATGLDFPAGAHEDVGHMPVMCRLANQVHYLAETVVYYRHRGASLSNTRWTPSFARDFVGVWTHFRDLLVRHGLEDLRGASAMMTARQALWKLQLNQPDRAALPEILEAVGEILRDAADIAPPLIRAEGMAHISEALASLGVDRATRSCLLGAVPAGTTIAHHRAILELEAGEPVPRHHKLPEAGVIPGPPAPVVLPTYMLPYPDQDAWSRNHQRAEALLERYRMVAPEASRDFPSMLTEGDKAVYFDAGLNFRGDGLIVDGGCFVGGTTHHLVLGLKHNTLFADDDPRLEGVVKVYDLFRIDDDYILEHLSANFPDRSFVSGGSFESVFREKMAADGGYLEVFSGDVMQSGYPFDKSIEVFGVDFCKALPVTDYVVRTFFPRLQPGSLVIQQDFIHEFHPHIHLSMMRLKDHFALDTEMRWGGSVTFRATKLITPDIVVERFGTDADWFQDRERNVPLLEELCADTFYDENRWVMLLTLGFYHYATGDRIAARAAYERACKLYPQFEPSEITRRHLSG